MSENIEKLAMDHQTRAKLVIQMQSDLDIERRKRKALEEQLSNYGNVSYFSSISIFTFFRSFTQQKFSSILCGFDFLLC